MTDDMPAVRPTQWPRNFEVRGSVHLDWMYPNIYPDTAPLDRITIGLDHVRAADSITIEFDGARNGWVIRMDRTRDDDGGMEPVEELAEVAFIPAWNDAPPSSHP